MAEMKISNTLVNDTSTGEIAYAEQLKDRNVDFSQLEKFTAEIIHNYSLDTKFQDKLNYFFLKHWNDYQRFLHDAGSKEGVIDSWHELEEFLAGISDSEGITLLNMIRDVQIKSGQLNIRMSTEFPGLVEAVTTNDSLKIQKSYIDKETGEIKIVYTFE